MTTQSTLKTATTCRTDGCDGEAFIMQTLCNYHEALRLVRELSVEQLAEFRDLLARTQPLTGEEKAERRLRSRLSYLRSQAEQTARVEEMARAEGATDDQIAEATRRG